MGSSYDVSKVDSDEGTHLKTKDRQLWRDLVAYWILGLCNNYGYVVMLSAAHDILAEFEEDTHEEPSHDFQRECNYISTGAILLADIIPALCIKFSGPFLPFFVHVRVTLCCGLAAAGFLLVGFAQTEWVAIVGVVCTSLASGLGELTFLAYSSKYNKNVVSTWSSGTGGAGIIGAVSYAGLRSLGLDTTQTLLVMLVVPAAEVVAFWGILRHNHQPQISATAGSDNPGATSDSNNDLQRSQEDVEKTTPSQTSYDEEDAPLIGFREKIRYIPKMFKYMIPLTLVYLFEYFINQGLFELVYFPNIWLDKAEQYRWLQVDYQIGVFISRSSVNIISFKRVWIMAVLQFVNVVFFLFEVFYFFSPSIWLIFAIVLWEGLLGGGAYVNTFYRMSSELSPNRKAFAISVTAVSDSVGIALAGLAAIPTHNAICRIPGGR
ncbi:battenin [Phlebotomus argentipes]|uniref:battenin n=1 Tax=Phlebotomus argentipes TaxID=94469 RepID=UPI0028936BA8|nr:battenin [Phlebotomus argentipes]